MCVCACVNRPPFLKCFLIDLRNVLSGVSCHLETLRTETLTLGPAPTNLPIMFCIENISDKNYYCLAFCLLHPEWTSLILYCQ